MITDKHILRFYLNIDNNTNIPRLFKYLKDSCKYDIKKTILLVFNLRDYRDGGKGLRNISRFCFIWLLLNYTEYFDKIFKYIPQYGRWDDLFCLIKLDLKNKEFLNENYISDIKDIKKIKDCQNNIVNFIVNQLNLDKFNMLKNNKISFLSKWFPSEKSSQNKKLKIYGKICKIMNINKKQLRQNYISPLRKYLNIIETNLCDKTYDKILLDFETSCSITKYENALYKNKYLDYQNWKKSKLKLKQLKCHEIISKIRCNNDTNVVLNTMWLQNIKNIKKHKTLFCIDNSPSMHGYTANISYSLAISLSETYNGFFKNKIINFSNEPIITNINENDLYNKIQQIKQIDWTALVNINKIYKTILKTSINNNILPENIPKNILIFTDIKFKTATITHELNIKKIKEEYNKNLFELPTIIFWNYNSNQIDFPIIFKENVKFVNCKSNYILQNIHNLINNNCIIDKNTIKYNEILNIL